MLIIGNRIPVSLTRWTVWLCLVMAVASEGSSRLLAQEVSVAAYDDADAALNATYKKLMASLSASERQALRNAQRAWIAFTEKNAPALQSLGKKRGLSAGALRRFYLAEVEARTEQLEAMMERPSQQEGAGLRGGVERADGALNTVYKACIEILATDDKERLRAAQHGWLTFRDEEVRANPRHPLTAMLLLLERRTTELSEFYLGEPRSASPSPVAELRRETAPSALTTPAAVKTPDPFERAR